jgi:hypothetical protein
LFRRSFAVTFFKTIEPADIADNEAEALVREYLFAQPRTLHELPKIGLLVYRDQHGRVVNDEGRFHLASYHPDAFAEGPATEELVWSIVCQYGSECPPEIPSDDVAFDRDLLCALYVATLAVYFARSNTEPSALEIAAAEECGLDAGTIQLDVMCGIIWAILDRSHRENQEFGPDLLLEDVERVQDYGTAGFLRLVGELLVR